MHAAASMCVTPTRADLNGLHERSHAAYIVPTVSDVPLRSCFMPAHKTGRRIRHPDVKFPSVKFGSASWVNTIVDYMVKGSTRLVRCAKRRTGPNRSTGLNSNSEASAGVNRAVRTALDLGYNSNVTYGVPALGGPKWWVADSGSGNDLISRKFLSAKDEKRIKASNPVTLNTANDTVVTSEVIPMKMSLTKEKIQPLVLKSVPPVMSIGRRCLQNGWEFHWYADCEPYFVTPDGKFVMLRVDQFVPLLTDDAKLLDALPDCVLEKALPRLLAMLPEELQGAVDRFLALPGTPDLAQGSDPPTVDSAAAGRTPGEAVPEGPAEATAEDEDEYAEILETESGEEVDVYTLD